MIVEPLGSKRAAGSSGDLHGHTSIITCACQLDRCIILRSRRHFGVLINIIADVYSDSEGAGSGESSVADPGR